MEAEGTEAEGTCIICNMNEKLDKLIIELKQIDSGVKEITHATWRDIQVYNPGLEREKSDIIYGVSDVEDLATEVLAGWCFQPNWRNIGVLNRMGFPVYMADQSKLNCLGVIKTRQGLVRYGVVLRT
jgi:hypothetical protein